MTCLFSTNRFPGENEKISGVLYYGEVMAFSAQTDHGQNEHKDAVLCEIGKETSKDNTKVCVSIVGFIAVPLMQLEAVFLCKLRGSHCATLAKSVSIQKIWLFFSFCVFLSSCPF